MYYEITNTCVISSILAQETCSGSGAYETLAQTRYGAA